MAKQTMARPAAETANSAARARPPRPASVPAFGGWEVAGDKAAAVPDYSLDFTEIRAARKHRRTKALSWSSFVGNAAVAIAVAGETTTTPGGGAGGGKEEEEEEGEEEEEKRQCSSAATSDGDNDDDRERRRHHHHRLRRLRCADDDDRQPIQPGRAAPKGRNKFFKGYLFGCVGGQW